MIAPPLRTTLTGVAAAMAGARDPWWIITGAAVALHGGATPVSDVDVLASRRDACRLLGDAAVPGEPSGRYRSDVFGRLAGWPLPVEIMADFELCLGGTWEAVRFMTREMVPVGAALLPVPARPELSALLTKLGRPKDHARLAMLGS